MCRKHFNLFLLVFIIIVSILISLNFVYATNCWTYTSNANCIADNNCKWRNDSWSTSGWCEDFNCWSLYTQSECTSNIVPAKNCTWQPGQTSYWCEKENCWGYSGTSGAACVNNSLGLSCDWNEYCYNSASGSSYYVNCWNYTTQANCTNATGCSWGQCYEKGCGSYATNTTCKAGKDYNGKNCTWETYDSNASYCVQNGCWKYGTNYSATTSQRQTDCGNTSLTGGLACDWKYDSCQDVDCWTWSYTNETACVNNTANLSCIYDQGSYCNKKDCWSYATNATCSSQANCNWKAYASSGWCQEVNCWTWDSYNSGNKTKCENNDANYGLTCLWNGNPSNNQTNGWCYKDTSAVTCSNITTERTCMDTYYCWWQYYNWNNVSAGGNCNSPGNFSGMTINTSVFSTWNPGCYIFDTNSTDCNNVIGCNYTASKCEAINVTGIVFASNITDNGINCTLVNSSALCNNIPALASCCVWQNSSCQENKLSTVCRDQMQAPPAGAAFCEDYNSYENQQSCEQIANYPWYMPCKWNNSTARCEFKASDVFGNETQSLMKIDNKKNCEAAGGKWITENYCEGNVSVPSGRCEYKFNEEDNCDKACFACELKDSDGSTVNVTNARASCKESKLGICEFSADTHAPNGIGYCKANEQYKKGIALDCDSTCGDCTNKGDVATNDTTKRPSYYCVNSKANSEGGGCKWVTDNSTIGGYCVNKGEKTCEDACDRCKTQTDCQNVGRTSVSNVSGSCEWEGDASTGECTSNIGENAEICWNGEDDNNNNLVDCADPSCYSDNYCGFVEGDCFGWITNASCVDHSCEWVTDKWGSFCDFKGSQCWKYAYNNTNCSSQSNCQWQNGTGSGWCEKNWVINEQCTGLNRTQCIGDCQYNNDSWCDGTGKGTDWCNTGGGWCNHEDFAPKNCWAYSSRSSCNNANGCSWHKDDYSNVLCEVNWSANCWQYSENGTCTNAGCLWKNESGSGWNSAWCDNQMSVCWSASASSQSGCEAVPGGKCRWKSESWGGNCETSCYSKINSSSCSGVSGCSWKEESGWCEEKGCWNYNQTGCTNATGEGEGCRWKTPGWCDPKGGGFSAATSGGGGGIGTAIGAECYKYDGNQTLCTNKTIINISCGWTVNPSPSCNVDWSTECWRYTSNNTGCNSTNGCWWNPGTGGSSGWCGNVMDECWSNITYQSWNNTDGWLGNCTSNYLCTNNSWNGCEPKCTYLNTTSCTNATYTGKCKYVSGWCNPKGMNDIFSGMEAGAPVPIGTDVCAGSETNQSSVDICGFGVKDMQDSYGFGAGVANFENASICNKEELSSFVMSGGATGGDVVGGTTGVGGGGGGPTMTFGAEKKVGIGNETIIFVVYLDTDGNSTGGGCALSHNSSAMGYEFRLKYVSMWNASTSKATETFNAYQCDDSDWKAADIKLSAWKKKMCSDTGGPMIAIEKADLVKFPTLYDSTKDIRVYVATIGNTGNISSPSDVAGPSWMTPGAIDFEIGSAFTYGANSAKFEDILKKGFVQSEDCFNSIDDDGDNNIDCNDWDCQYSDKCTGTGVNAASYIDTGMPRITGVKIEEYPDAALIMFDTNKPTNATLISYEADSTCTNIANESTSGGNFFSNVYTYPDIGLINSDVRTYRTWHKIEMYEGTKIISSNGSIITTTWPVVVSGVTKYYKLKICDANGKCAISKCSSFKIPSIQKCSYCNFVTRIKAPSGWEVYYDLNEDGIYEHWQGHVCGPNAGLKTNYTEGRRANIKINNSDGSVYFEFINVTLTKSGLNDKVRTISASGDIIYNTATGTVGMISATRDKIINNLYPEICRIKIPYLGTCDKLYHCDDNGQNCTDRTANATLLDATNCIWKIPYCEFSTYRESITTTTTPPPSGDGGGGGGGGGGGAATYTLTNEQFLQGYTKELAKNDQFKINISGGWHFVKLVVLTSTTATINVSSTPQQATLSIGEEKKFDVTGDGKNDLSVKLNSINSTASKTSLTVKAVIQETPAEKGERAPTTGETIKEGEKGKEVGEIGELGKFNFWWIVILAAAVAVIIIISAKYKGKTGKSNGIVMISSNFIEALRQKIHGKDYKGKWIDLR